MSVSDDIASVRSVLAGDKPAFAALVDRHRSAAVSFARRIVGDAEAEDVVQEAFLGAFLGLARLRDPAKFGAWLLGIVANLSKSRLRARREGYQRDPIGGRFVPGRAVQDCEPSAETVAQTRQLHGMLSDAIDALPEEQRESVRLHYFAALRLSEIAVLTGSPLGTIKARLHHARARLRESLLNQLVPVPGAASGGIPMTEVSVSDVIVRVPKAGEVKWLDLGTYQKLGVIRIVLLREHSGERVLPIWIGSGEGDVIAMQLEGLTMERPSTFALTVRLIETGGMKLEKIGITALRGNVYYATMWLNAGGTVHEIDARPSDAITLALAMNAPIFVSEETWKEATSVSAGNEMAGLEEQLHTAIDKGRAPVEAVEMEYRSYRSLPRGEIPGIKPGRTEPAA